MKGKVYIIGAGCGAYDLITLRGMKFLQKADVIVYDALIDRQILFYAQKNAELICVGKRAGFHSFSQEEINCILVRKALQGYTVARLKGGDPFVFGRGGEEILALKENDIEYIVIPAVSSATAVPELAGIPVTHRNISRSFHVITGHTSDENTDYSKYACLDGTLVFLMGLGNIETIANQLIKGGMKEDTPAAVISHGAYANQCKITGTISDIAKKVADSKCPAPAVIVTGDTAGMDFSQTLERPLERVRISVAGTREFCGNLSEKLENLGAEVVSIPHILLKENEHLPELDKAFEIMEKYDCIVFTGRHGAEMFLKRLVKSGTDIRCLAGIKIAVTGSSTAEFLKERGLFAEFVPEKFTSGALGKLVAEKIGRDKKILVIRAEKSSSEFENEMQKLSIVYDDIRLYDTITNTSVIPEYIDTDYIIFGSTAGIRGFFESGAEISEDTKIVCIGDVTASAYRNRKNIITASPHTADGIIQSIIMEEKYEKVQKASQQ